MEKLRFNIAYNTNGVRKVTTSEKNDDFVLKIEFTNNRLKISILPKTPIEITSFQITTPFNFFSDSRVFINGYQSWTDSREYFIDERMPVLHKRVKKKVMTTALCKAGDLQFREEETQSGVFHGYSYSYVRNVKVIDLFGSISEKTGYTIFSFDANKNFITITKDVDGVVFTKETQLIDVVHIVDDYDTAFDKYFETMGIPKIESEIRSGYTTWYNYYGNINEKIVRRDLAALGTMDDKVEFFQIDDGYQKAIGDWLITDMKKFPSGMKSMAEDIHSNGMKAGLWLAPFAAAPSSEVFKNHPDWFIQENGHPFEAGQNWGGFYALNIYNDDAKNYIKHCFDVVLNEWDYDMVKLDFLYACCEKSINNKSRGEIMCDAMDLLRECVGDKLILGCGVPMHPAFGKVDFCRIGADMGLSWKRNNRTTREDVSTPNAINNTVFRRHLNGRAFLNDPDVFLLRDKNIYMSLKKRMIIAKINHIFGSILFTSDNVLNYDEKKTKIFISSISKNKEKIISAEFVKKDILSICYIQDEIEHTLKFNVEKGKVIGAACNLF